MAAAQQIQGQGQHMVGPTPQKKIQEIHEKVNGLGRSVANGNPLDETEWARLKREAVQLQSISGQKAAAFVAEAYLWSLKLNIKKFNECMAKAEQLGGPTHLWHSVRAVSAHRFGKAEMAFGLIDSGIARDNVTHMKNALSVASQNGMIVTAKTLIKQLEQSGVDIFSDLNFKDTINIGIASEYILSNNIDEREIAKRVSFGCGVVHKLGYTPTGYQIIPDEDGGMTFEYKVEASDDDRADIDMEIIEKVIAKFGDDMSRHISLATAHPV